MVASDICVLTLDEEDLPKSSLSVVLVGTASDNSEINDDKITLNLNAREYIDNQHNKFLLFNLYHFPDDSHLLPITTKVTRGSSLYITGYLSLIEDLLLVRVTQINFIESNYSTSNKSSKNYAWEKKQAGNSLAQSTSAESIPSASDIAKSFLEKPNKKRTKYQTTTLPHSLKIPKLSSLALSQSNAVDNNQDETSQNEIQPENPNPNPNSNNENENENEQEEEMQVVQGSRPKRKKRK
jgi:hypothetical protein